MGIRIIETDSIYQSVGELLMRDKAKDYRRQCGQNYILIKPYANGCNLNPLDIAMLNRVSIKAY